MNKVRPGAGLQTDSVEVQPITSRAWHREPMVWMVIAIPLTAVLVGIAYLTTAIVTWDGLVVDDYYKQGKEINQVLARDTKAQELGLTASLKLTDMNDGLMVDVSSSNPALALLDPVLEVRFLHRTRAGFDRVSTLKKVATGQYAGPGVDVSDGLWRIQIEAPEWRLVKNITLPASDDVLLRHEP